MNDFALELEKKLQEKDVYLEMNLDHNGLIVGEWLKNEIEILSESSKFSRTMKTPVWHGHAYIPISFLEDYPYILKIMRDYGCDLDIELQDFTNIYWVRAKSYSHSLVYARNESLLEALKELNQRIYGEYQNTIHFFEEEILKLSESDEGLWIEGCDSVYTISPYRLDKFMKKDAVPGDTVRTLLSDYEEIRNLLLKQKYALVLCYLLREKEFSSTFVALQGYDNFLASGDSMTSSIEHLREQVLEKKQK